MRLSAALAFAALLSLTLSAEAGGRRVEYRRPAPAAGTVNNFYGPTTVYQGTAPGYGYDYSGAAPYGGAYAYGNAGAYAGSSAYGSYGAYYGADYGAQYGQPWGPPFAGGVGYSPYGNYGGYYGYGAVYGGRMDPWNGYYGGPGNGYW
jgi:hypothetical protein